MSKRIERHVPDETLGLLHRVTTRDGRGPFVFRIALHDLQSCGEENMRERLKAGYQANAQENLKIALEWFPLEEEAGRESRRSTESRKWPTSRSEA